MSIRILVGATVLLGAALAPAAAHAERYGDTVECTSRDYGFTRCGVPWKNARLVDQTSDTRCVRGRNWGVDRGGLWVNGGCAGVFRREGGWEGGNYYDREEGGGGWRPGPGWDTRFIVRCSSENYSYGFCAVDVGRGGRVNLRRQLSNSPCVEGNTWGWNRAGVWVNGGCEGEFEVDRRWR
jgi:hypothetical protein